uniref:Centrosomal protein kizuna n=1 Tax=Oreochromis niloticus TaxID=8128 RepID=A0A669EQK2_ORENI
MVWQFSPGNHGGAGAVCVGNTFSVLSVCREKRRLELERELFAYSRSDKRALQIKCSKLRSYLKEICDREARAKMRNLELLRDVECIEISMKEYSPDHAPLQQQKVEHTRSHQDRYVSHPAKDFKQAPVEIFMGHQTSRGPDAEAGSTSVHSHQALHHSPNRSLHSRERLPSGLLKDFTVGGEDAASNRAHLSDDISGSNDSPDDGNLSDKHERTMGPLPSVRALTGTAGGVAFGSDDEREPSPLATLTGPEKNPSPGSSSPTRAQNSIAEHTDSKEVVREARTMEDEERGHGHLMLKTTFRKELTALYILGSLCDDGADLNDEDLGACGAVVLHELQRLSWSTEKGCLLPQDLVCAHQSSTEPNEISTSLPPNAARLWDRWFKHALVLKERRVLSTERLVQLFTPLLLSRHATYSHQVASKAHPLQQHAHKHKQEVTHLHPKSALISTPFFPAIASHYALPFLTELQSAEEDSQDESPVESGPIRGKKALPVPQHSHCPYVVVYFWGQSDDSNSEIEAALRPQPFNNDGIYDFYE